MKKFIPQKVLDFYHLAYAVLGAYFYRHPSRKLFVIGVTGTKGKSTTAELIRVILESAGHTVALTSTIHFRIGNEVEPNLLKMTMPGHAYLQKFMRQALEAKCTHVVIEMTSEGAKQFRHKGIELDALVFTNLQPEHIESHGSMELYAQAKLSLASALEDSAKRPRYIVANMDDAYGEQFLETNVEVQVPFSISMAEPHTVDDKSVRFVYRGGEFFTVPLPGLFNLRNILATLALGEAMGIDIKVMQKALEYVKPILGRAERIEAGQNFTIIVDYAHTPDSLAALFDAYKSKRIIAVMGSTGGGRDQWKRPLMGEIADTYCDIAILTNEDPYDEDPHSIMSDIAKGFTEHKPKIIFDRRKAIHQALKDALTLAQDGKAGDVAVLITGKGTDPYIMGPHKSRQGWSDKKVAIEELHKLTVY